MTDDILVRLKYDLNQLRQYISFNTKVNALLGKKPAVGVTEIPELVDLRLMREDFRKKKVFEYNSYIISLYGFFERFVENLLENYLESLLRLTTHFQFLPLEIQNNYISLHTEFLKFISYPKYSHLNEKDVIFAMNGALNENSPKIFLPAYIHHSSNFRHSSISDYFQKVGVANVNGNIKNYEPLKSLLSYNFSDYEQLKSDVLFSIIDELALRRNEVAHGSELTSLLSNEIIIDYVSFIENYCTSLYALLLNEYNKLLFSSSTNFITPILRPTNYVICCELENRELNSESIFIIKKPDGNFPQFERRFVTSLEISREKHEAITITEKTKIGIQFSKIVKDNYQIVLI